MGSTNDFKKQIDSDISEYQEKYGEYVPNIKKNEWAFNFWILDKFFYIDELEIQDYIVDYRDKGIDCYYYYEDTRELYLIQNKYYNTTKLTGSYLEDDVYSRSINLLKNNSYTRSKKLQQIYNENKNKKDFKVYIEIYVTNNTVDSSAIKAAKKFNEQYNSSNIFTKIYYLDDIYKKFYHENADNHQTFNYILKRINRKATLEVDSQLLNLDSNIDSRYMILSVIDIYEMIKASKDSNYDLVKENVRDYAGPTAYNKDIAETLNSDEDRSNFLYYNNGITIICDKFSNASLINSGKYKLINPQIVNGCQTVNTIYDVLSMIGDEREIKRKYNNCFVMAKILIIDDPNKKQLYKNIVTYNNNQNAINKKDFEAITPKYLRLREQYEKKGFLLCVRPSDKYQFSNKYTQVTPLKTRARDYLEMFRLNFDTKKQFLIPLDKFLQIILAYTMGSCNAYQKKSNLLKPETPIYQTVTNFILEESINTDLLLLYLLYSKSEQTKKASKDNRFPVSYMLIDGFSRFECQGGKISIAEALSSQEKIDEVIKIYTKVTKKYYEYFKTLDSSNEYNDMAKSEINYTKFKEIYNDVLSEMKEKKK